MKFLGRLSILCAFSLAFLASGCETNRQATDAAKSPPENSPIRVGHANMEALFHSYAKTEEFHQKAGDIQQKFQELEEEDFEQMMQLQGEFQVIQMELFQSFQADVEKTAKTISEDINLDLVATEILYQSEQTELIDITELFLETDLFKKEHAGSDLCGPEHE